MKTCLQRFEQQSRRVVGVKVVVEAAHLSKKCNSVQDRVPLKNVSFALYSKSFDITGVDVLKKFEDLLGKCAPVFMHLVVKHFFIYIYINNLLLAIVVHSKQLLAMILSLSAHSFSRWRK